MAKINVSSWGTFIVGDLFRINPTKHYKLTNAKLFANEGETPVVVNSSYNNGIGGYVSYEPTEKGNIITFSDTTSSSAIFYQPVDFIGYSHVQGMYPKDNRWSKESLLFFLTIFKRKAHLLGFDYVNKFTREMAKNIEVNLPIDSKGDINFSYMENYISSQSKKTNCIFEVFQKINFGENTHIDITNWKLFNIIDLFELHLSKGDNQQNKLLEGTIPLVSAGGTNNGICKYILVGDEESQLFRKNTITVDMFGQAFYQPEDFYAVSHGRVNILVPRFNLNKNIALFLITVMTKKFANKYAFSSMCSQKALKKETILLPCKKNGEPDYDYMQLYISKLFTYKNIKKRLSIV